jgi:hypothetical protein
MSRRLLSRVVPTMVYRKQKNDSHDFWLIVYPTNSINGNPFHKQYKLSNVPFGSSVSGTEKT